MDTRPLTTSSPDALRRAQSSFSPPRILPFAFPGVPGVRAVFTTALAGNLSLHPHLDAAALAAAEVLRRELAAALGFQSWTELNQVHRDGFLQDPAPTAADRHSALEGDGSCTAAAQHALVIKTADCQPILLANRQGTAVAALHAGWRGNALRFPTLGVQAFCRAYGISPSDVLAVRGPSLGPAAAEFVNFDKEWPPEFAPWFNRQSSTMDLWSLTRHQLMEAGVPAGQIFGLDLCTWSLPHLLFSYRRGAAGRQMALIWRE